MTSVICFLLWKINIELMTSKVKAIKEHRTISKKLEEYTEYNLKKLFVLMIETDSHLYELKHKLDSLSRLYCFDIFNFIDEMQKGFIKLEDVRLL